MGKEIKVVNPKGGDIIQDHRTGIMYIFIKKEVAKKNERYIGGKLIYELINLKNGKIVRKELALCDFRYVYTQQDKQEIIERLKNDNKMSKLERKIKKHKEKCQE